MPAPANSTPLSSRIFVLLLLTATTAAFIGMVRDLLFAVLLAAIFSGLLQPVFGWALPMLGHRRTLTAVSVLVLSILAVGLPVAGLVAVVVAEALNVSRVVGPYLSEELSDGVDLAGVLPDWASRLEPYQSRILSSLGDWANAAAGGLVQSVTRVTQGTVLFVVNLGVMVYAMFFFLRDGPEWLQRLVGYLPLRPDARASLLQKGFAITRATVRSIVVIGALQGFLVGLAFWMAGLPGSAFWGTLVVPASALPALGAPLIWLPGALFLLIEGQVGWALFVAGWGVLVVGAVDNLLRARLIGATTRMSDLLVLVATLGGIGTFGPVGIIVGPVLAGLLLTVLDIYQEAFRDVLAEANGPVES